MRTASLDLVSDIPCLFALKDTFQYQDENMKISNQISFIVTIRLTFLS